MKNYSALTMSASLTDVVAPTIVAVASAGVCAPGTYTDKYAIAKAVKVMSVIMTNYDSTNPGLIQLALTSDTGVVKAYLHNATLKPGESAFIDTFFYVDKTEKLRVSSTTANCSILIAADEV